MSFKLAPDANVEEVLVQEVHTYSSISRWSFTKAALSVFMLGVMLATQGTASQLAGSLTKMSGLTGMPAMAASGDVTAGLVSATVTTAASLVQNEFHMGKVIKDVKGFLGSKNLLSTVIKGSVGGGALTGAVIDKVVLNKKIEADRVLMDIVGDVLQTVGSQHISGLKASGQINSGTQVLMHGAVHGVGGAIRGIPDGRDGMTQCAGLSAVGAMSAEILANILVDPTQKAAELVKANPNMDDASLERALRAEFMPMRNTIQLLTASIGLLVGDERAVGILAQSAGIALDHNTFGPYGMAVAVAAARLAQAKDAVMRGATAVNQASQATARVLTSVGRAGVNAAKEMFKRASNNALRVSQQTKDGAAKELRNSTRGGESTATAAGRRAHKNYGKALGEEFDTKAVLPSKKRPDAVNWTTREVRELKPDNARAVARGERQVEGYRKELEAMTGEPWTSVVDVYRAGK